ncbi:MAG: cytochrome c-type biogenesis protein CcmH, partial [Rhizobiaceae bacterium]
QPRFSWQNAALWGAPVVLLAAGGVFLFYSARRRRVATAAVAPATLSAEENAALDRLLRDGE